ncbi:hypothetical protein HK098_000256 [Nowakowskiella sp. JEL0407]|nr:hypothetical protein HK098_000256 [Nowakowskiella sp. JEL0407]
MIITWKTINPKFPHTFPQLSTARHSILIRPHQKKPHQSLPPPQPNQQNSKLTETPLDFLSPLFWRRFNTETHTTESHGITNVNVNKGKGVKEGELENRKKYTSTQVLAIAVTSLDVWGGKSRPTWSLQLSIAVPIYRHIMNRYKYSVETARQVVESFSKTPLPKSVSCIPFTIPKRADIFIEDLMRPEDAQGKVSGEWIQWHEDSKSQSKTKLMERNQDSECTESRSTQDPLIFFLHGGAYFMCSAEIHRSITWRLSKYSKGARVFSVDYGKAPEHPFPMPLHDAISAYLSLVDPKDGGVGYDPKKIVVCGDSAGGGLAIALTLWLRDHPVFHKFMPGGIACLAPWLDLTHSMPSWINNEATDYVPSSAEDPRYIKKGERSHYYTKSDSQNSHPLVSPLFSNEYTPATFYDNVRDSSNETRRFDSPRTLPPTLIHVGGAERLRDESLMFAISSAANSQVRVEIWQDQPHVFQVFTFLGEELSAKSLQRLGEFVTYVTKTDVNFEEEEQKKGIFWVDSKGKNAEIGVEGARKIIADGWDVLRKSMSS